MPHQLLACLAHDSLMIPCMCVHVCVCVYLSLCVIRFYFIRHTLTIDSKMSCLYCTCIRLNPPPPKKGGGAAEAESINKRGLNSNIVCFISSSICQYTDVRKEIL